MSGLCGVTSIFIIIWRPLFYLTYFHVETILREILSANQKARKRAFHMLIYFIFVPIWSPSGLSELTPKQYCNCILDTILDLKEYL